MQTRKQILNIRRGEFALSIERDDSTWPSKFIGSIGGRKCVVAPTKASAMRTLLMRVAHECEQQVRHE